MPSLPRHIVAARKLGTSLLAFGLVACAKPSSGTAPPSSAAAPSASAAASERATLAPPDDAARSCTATLTGKMLPSPAGEPGLQYEVKNTGTRAWRFCHIYVFGYDAAGARVSSASEMDNIPMKPGEERISSAGLPLYDESHQTDAGVPGSTFEILSTQVTFADGSEWTDPTFSFQTHRKPTGSVITLAHPNPPQKSATTGKKLSGR